MLRHALAEIRDAVGHSNVRTTSCYLRIAAYDEQELGGLPNGTLNREPSWRQPLPKGARKQFEEGFAWERPVLIASCPARAQAVAGRLQVVKETSIERRASSMRVTANIED